MDRPAETNRPGGLFGFGVPLIDWRQTESDKAAEYPP